MSNHQYFNYFAISDVCYCCSRGAPNYHISKYKNVRSENRKYEIRKNIDMKKILELKTNLDLKKIYQTFLNKIINKI